MSEITEIWVRYIYKSEAITLDDQLIPSTMPRRKKTRSATYRIKMEMSDNGFPYCIEQELDCIERKLVDHRYDDTPNMFPEYVPTFVVDSKGLQECALMLTEYNEVILAERGSGFYMFLFNTPYEVLKKLGSAQRIKDYYQL